MARTRKQSTGPAELNYHIRHRPGVHAFFESPIVDRRLSPSLRSPMQLDFCPFTLSFIHSVTLVPSLMPTIIFLTLDAGDASYCRQYKWGSHIQRSLFTSPWITRRQSPSPERSYFDPSALPLAFSSSRVPRTIARRENSSSMGNPSARRPFIVGRHRPNSRSYLLRSRT